MPLRTDVGSTLRAELDFRKFAPEYRRDLYLAVASGARKVSPARDMIAVHGLKGRPTARTTLVMQRSAGRLREASSRKPHAGKISPYPAPLHNLTRSKKDTFDLPTREHELCAKGIFPSLF